MKIKSIKKLPEKRFTVDIETESTHTYQLSNGWISHNTTSQMTDTSSGIHTRFAPYYIRRVRSDVMDPLANLLKQFGIPCEPERLKPDSMLVFSFPIKSPPNSVFRHDLTAIDQLELYLTYKQNYTTHCPSITVHVKEDEWLEVGAWVYENFDQVIGLTFLPYSDHSYQQAPYEEITEEQYTKMLETFPTDFDWSLLSKLEKHDNTEGARELACVAGACELY